MTARRPQQPVYPKISLVTPSFNQGQFLEQTVRSILDQEYPNLEYIIIDGGSSDESKKIIKQYAPRLKYWVSEKDKGQADAINKGFSHATGEIMGWLNSDDVLMPGSLHLIAKIFQELPDTNWISSTPQTITQHGHVHHLGLRPVYIQKLIREGWYHGLGLGFIMQEGTFWRSKLWKDTGGKVKDLHFGMDYELWKRFASKTSLLPVHVPLAAFRLNPQRKSKAIEKYYQEVGVRLPAFFAIIGKMTRIALQVPRKLRLTEQLYYDLSTERWQYSPDLWSKITGKKQPHSFA